jgi:hypothetical protein
MGTTIISNTTKIMQKINQKHILFGQITFSKGKQPVLRWQKAGLPILMM